MERISFPLLASVNSSLTFLTQLEAVRVADILFKPHKLYGIRPVVCHIVKDGTSTEPEE